MNTQTYIDYEAILAKDFTPQAYANRLVLQTNDANDTSIDLATPLSKVLFDAQEVDTHIDALSTQNALPLVQHTTLRSEAAQQVLTAVEQQVSTLSESYDRLAKEVGERYEAAAQMQLAAERLVRTVRLGRAVQRALTLGRQLQTQVDESDSATGHHSLVPGAQSITELRQLFAATGKGQEAEGIGRVLAVTQLRNEIVPRAEPLLLSRAQRIISRFNMSTVGPTTGPSTFREAEESRDRTIHALQALYLLSSPPGPKLMVDALEKWLQEMIKWSLQFLSNAFGRLVHAPELMQDICARSQNIVALEALLSTTRPPRASEQDGQETLLTPLLARLSITGRQSLFTYFWFQLAKNIPGRLDTVLAPRSNISRMLRSGGDALRSQVRDTVHRGSQLPVSASLFSMREVKNNDWEQVARVVDNSFRSLDRKP